MAIYRTPMFTIETSPVGTFAVGGIRLYDNFSGATFDVPSWVLPVVGIGLAALVGYALIAPQSFRKTFMLNKFKVPKMRLPKFKL